MRRIALLAFALVAAVAGCAQELDDIDRTQPNRVQKSLFEGEWYLARTVVDVPYTTQFTFTGESAELERVRWEIQRDLLVAYRVYDRVEGTDRAVSYTDAPYQGAPVVAYRIESHFDITRDYNAQTGEQTNVLLENTEDRPWYDREYMRVDWSQNVLPSLTFLINWDGPDYTVEAPVSYVVDDPENPHHMVVGTRGTDGSWTDVRTDAAIAALKSADYLETTVRVAVQPEYVSLEDWDGSILRDPACWYEANADCEHQNITVRMSFTKVPETSSYQPMEFPDNAIARDTAGKPIRVSRGDDGNITADPSGTVVRHEYFDKFGFFRTERRGYDAVYGETESDRVYLINRHNLYDGSGNPKPIIYYKNADFPDWLDEAAAQVAATYDGIFKEAVQARGKTPPEHMFEIRDNTGQRVGDMRYNFLFYVPRPTRAGLLGYGPANCDPLTGEIVSATAYIYGAPLEEYAGRGRQIVDLLTGRLTPEELGLGADVQAALAVGHTPATPATKASLEAFVREHVDTPRGKAIKRQGKEAFRRSTGQFQARLARVAGTPFESLLTNDEVKLLKGHHMVGPGDSLTPEMQARVSPVAWLSKGARQSQRDHAIRMAMRAMDKATFSDDAIMGLAQELAKENLTPEAVLRRIQIAVAKSTAEHELGHTLGLRHNFAGSADALNFPRHFWELQGADAEFPPKPRTAAQIEGRMDEYRYSSIMEYGGRFNSDIQGVGAYDRAALLFGYSQMVEVFDSAPVDPLADAFTDVFDLRFDLQEHRHYSSLPGALGGVEALLSRHFVPYEDLQAQYEGRAPYTAWEVPYRFCSDEYEGARWDCAVYDAGMDPYEIVTDLANRYFNYYFLQAFKGDRADWDPWYYDGDMWDRYFRHMLTQFQFWAFDRFDAEDLWDSLREDADYFEIEDVAWTLARDGGAPATAATQAALRFLVQVVAQPQPGGYVYDPDNSLYWRWTPDTTLYPTCTGVKEKDDPEVDCLDLNVAPGVGRYSFTSYDPADGYYFYERPKWVGAFTDKILALQVLADPEVNFIGVNTSEDVQGYALGFWLYFPEILSKISGGIINDRVAQFAGTTEDGVYTPPDPFGPAPGAEAVVVDPDTWSTVQYYAMWLAMAGYPLGFDNTFNDLAHVWYEGSGDGQSVPDVNDPDVATWYDAETRRTYHAVKNPDATLYSLGYEMLKRAAELEQQAEAADPADRPYYQSLVSYHRELIDLTVGMWNAYSKLTF